METSPVNRIWQRRAVLLSFCGGHLPGAGSRPRTAVNTRWVLSERRRRFPQVLPDN
jgi:hypothetical protein